MLVSCKETHVYTYEACIVVFITALCGGYDLCLSRHNRKCKFIAMCKERFKNKIVYLEIAVTKKHLNKKILEWVLRASILFSCTFIT